MIFASNTVQYLSLSGFISTIQFIFRSLEIIYSLFKNVYWIWIILQLAVSIIGIITYYDYKYKILKKNVLAENMNRLFKVKKRNIHIKIIILLIKLFH